jgi:multicomponent Na+:H+ antiporter subunit G
MGVFLLFAGGFFLITGVVGLYRLPDFFTRCHALTLTDLLGVPLVLFAVWLLVGSQIFLLKLLLLIIFLWVGSALSAHILVQIGLYSGLTPMQDEKLKHVEKEQA